MPDEQPKTAQEPVSDAPSVVDEETVTPEDFEEARVGTFVDVVSGEYAGLYGAYIKPEDDGLALVRNRDHGNDFPEYVSVRHLDLRPSRRTGGR